MNTGSEEARSRMSSNQLARTPRDQPFWATNKRVGDTTPHIATLQLPQSCSLKLQPEKADASHHEARCGLLLRGSSAVVYVLFGYEAAFSLAIMVFAAQGKRKEGYVSSIFGPRYVSLVGTVGYTGK